MIVPVDTFAKALQLRKIRNECREFMTRDRGKIGVLRQWRYWRSRKSYDKWSAHLIYREGVPIAFGVIDGNEITGGVSSKWRGLGIGRRMFSFLTTQVEKPGVLEVQDTNEAAISLYKSLGWKQDFNFGGVITMVKYQ